MKIFVTGANGFVGRHVVRDLASKGHQIVALVRRERAASDEALPNVAYCVGDLTATPDFQAALDGIDVILHLAGKAHSRTAESADADAAYRAVNCDAVATLARAAAKAGVKRFVLLSTIHVNGSMTQSEPFREDSPVNPAGVYGRSKYAGENRLVEIAGETGLEWCIVRPSLVVGRDGKANLAKLISLVASGLPLPVRALHNRRNLIGLRNLSAFLELCLTHPRAANALFLVADQPALSTGDLASRLAQALGKPRRQFPIPGMAWRLAAAIPGVERRLGALWQSLEIDTAKAERELGWRQPYPLDTIIAELGDR